MGGKGSRVKMMKVKSSSRSPVSNKGQVVIGGDGGIGGGR
jgi:hypothetical protein